MWFWPKHGLPPLPRFSYQYEIWSTPLPHCQKTYFAALKCITKNLKFKKKFSLLSLLTQMSMSKHLTIFGRHHGLILEFSLIDKKWSKLFISLLPRVCGTKIIKKMCFNHITRIFYSYWQFCKQLNLVGDCM